MNDLNIIKSYSKSAFEFILEKKYESCEDGRYELENGVYVNIESYMTQVRNERKFESHQKYIDIQYMLDGEELITVCSTNELIVCDKYNFDKDIEFYSNELKGEDFYINSGDFVILKPGQAHMPCICVNGRKKVRKAVFKIPVK